MNDFEKHLSGFHPSSPTSGLKARIRSSIEPSVPHSAGWWRLFPYAAAALLVALALFAALRPVSPPRFALIESGTFWGETKSALVFPRGGEPLSITQTTSSDYTVWRETKTGQLILDAQPPMDFVVATPAFQ